MTDALIHDCHALIPGSDGLSSVARNRDILLREGRIVSITPIQILEDAGLLEGHCLIAHGCGILFEVGASMERLARRVPGRRIQSDNP